jgi:hypothetical protein
MITDDRSKTKVSFSLYYLYDIINDRPMVLPKRYDIQSLSKSKKNRKKWLITHLLLDTW